MQRGGAGGGRAAGGQHARAAVAVGARGVGGSLAGGADARGARNERTLEIYRQRWDTHIRPHVRAQADPAVGVSVVSRFLEELRRKTKPQRPGHEPELLSNWTVRGVINILNVVVEHAVNREYVASNPDAISIPHGVSVSPLSR